MSVRRRSGLRWRLTLHWLAAIVVALAVLPALARAEPLPSWNDTPTKQAILDFVKDVTTPGNPNFVIESERIAVFDMDGTLIPERPVPAALVPILVSVRKAVTDNPILASNPAISALLKGDTGGLVASGEEGLNAIVAASTHGRTTEEVSAEIAPLMANTPHPKFGIPTSRATYRPMLELLEYLSTSGFTNWICSGSPVLFTRALSLDMFGIPPERVMGSNAGTRLDMRDGRTVLVFDGRIDHINDKEGKPPTINLAIGMRPLFVGGNIGGRGDIAMMRWSKDREGPSFQLLVNHDDAEREYAYTENDNYSLAAATKYGFTVVSIKNDWKTIVAP